MPDEFDDPLAFPPPAARRGAGVDTTPRHRFAAARLVSRVYVAASAPLRADMLACLLRPLSTLSLVAVASGAFARLLQRDGSVPEQVPLEDVTRYSSDQIFDLAQFVHEGNPEVLRQLAALLADHPLGVTALSASALLLLYRRWRAGPADDDAAPPGSA
jgi:hypothetical protein